MYLKYLLNMLILFCISNTECICAQIYCPAEETFNGPVIYVKESVYKLHNRSVIGSYDEPELDTIRLFEKALIRVNNGLIIEKQILGANDSPYCHCTKTYASADQPIEKTTFNYNGKIDTRIVNTWENGLLTRIDRYNVKDSLYSSTVCIRNEFIEISKELVDDIEDNIIYTELNHRNQPLKSYTIDSLGSKKLFAEFEYDTLGRISSTHIWNTDKKYDQHFFTFYDSIGRVNRRDWFDRDGNFMVTDSLVYDSNSNIVFERSYDFIKGYSTSNFYKYHFDQYGNILIKENWTIYYDRKQLTSRILREYTYE